MATNETHARAPHDNQSRSSLSWWGTNEKAALLRRVPRWQLASRRGCLPVPSVPLSALHYSRHLSRRTGHGPNLSIYSEYMPPFINPNSLMAQSGTPSSKFSVSPRDVNCMSSSLTRAVNIKRTRWQICYGTYFQCLYTRFSLEILCM